MINLVGCAVSQIVAVMILSGVIVDLVKFVEDRFSRMSIVSIANLLDYVTEPIIRVEIGGVRGAVVRFEHHATFLDQIERLTGPSCEVCLQIVDLTRDTALAGLLQIRRQEL